MLRSAASPGSVGFGRSERGLSGLLVSAAFSTGHPIQGDVLGLATNRFVRNTFIDPIAASAIGAQRPASGRSPLFDLAFLEFNVLAGDRIVFLEDELLGLVPRILLGCIVIAGARAAHELDLLRDGLCHLILADPKVGRTLLATTGKSRPGYQHAGPLRTPASKLSIFSSSALGSKPCMSSAHCRPTRAPLITGRSRSASSTVSGSQIASCTHIGGR